MPANTNYFYKDVDKKSGLNPRCKECVKEDQLGRKAWRRRHKGKKYLRMTLEEVKEYCASIGMEFLNEEYYGVKGRYDFKCVCGRVYNTSFQVVKLGHKCPDCAVKKLRKSRGDFLTKEELKGRFTSKGLILLDTEYGGIKKKYRYVCICGNEYEKTLEELEKSYRCWDCYIEAVSGENSHLWVPELSEEDRTQRRNYPEYREWRTSVLERDDYECQECGNTEDLHAHHIDPYSLNRQLRTDVDNGITLCGRCHRETHKDIPLREMDENTFFEYFNRDSFSTELEIDYDHELGEVCYNTIIS